MNVEDTTRRPLETHIDGATVAGLPAYIENMEAVGTRQLFGSDILPADMTPADTAEWQTLGFAFGDPVDGDPLFRRATLPDGWRREGSGDPRGGYLVDPRGIRRVTIWYKAAFYDRRADMVLVNVGGDLARTAIYGDGEPTAPWDLLTDAERADVVKAAEAYARNAAECPQVYGKRLPRAEALLAQAEAFFLSNIVDIPDDLYRWWRETRAALAKIEGEVWRLKKCAADNAEETQ
mgnify:CR=1 FL=1